MAAKKKTTAAKRPPRQVWLVVGRDGRPLDLNYARRRDAEHWERAGDYRVVGPYVLAERARER
jgi:hypothetical protein